MSDLDTIGTLVHLALFRPMSKFKIIKAYGGVQKVKSATAGMAQGGVINK